MLEILWESPGCDTEKWAHAVGKNGTIAGLLQTLNLFKKKNAISTKLNKASYAIF